MNPQPKPTPRAKKAPKPIARRSTRKPTPTPLAKKKLHPERYCNDPDAPRCVKTPLHLGRCGGHADEYLFALRRAIVVKNECELQDWHAMTNTRCNGVLQDNHGLSRGYTRGNLHWDPANGFSGCAGANTTAHYRPLEWTEFLKMRWGKEEHQRRVEIALHGPKQDYDAAFAMLAPTGLGEPKEDRNG